MYVTLKLMRAVLLFLAAVGNAAGQKDIFDLATTGDGGTVYFASTLARSESGEAAQPGAPGRIFRIGPEGLQLYLERPRIDPPPATGTGLGQIRFTNYFNLSRPQTSRDGNVVAVTGQRQCFGSSACASATTLQTTVTGLPGGTLEVTGAGRLSGNRRYLLIFADGSPGSCGYVVDLQAGQQARPEQCAPAGFSALGGNRAIADDGTAVSAAGSLYLIRGPAVTPVQVSPGSPGEAVIDSAARIVVYSMFDWGTSRRSIRIYRIADQRDGALAALPGADSHTPSLSADGRRVLFLSDASGLPQIYTIGTDGGEPRQVSRDSTGVLTAAMSDDGKVAWYLSGAARLYRINLDTGEAQERLGRTPQIGMWQTRMTAGCLYYLSGAGFSDRAYGAESYPLPRSLGGVSVSVNGVDSPLVSVSPTEILLQVPFQTGLETNVEVKTESSSPFVPQLRFATSTLTGFGEFLRNSRSPSGYGGSDAFTVHQDWSALVTTVTPALPGEILHLYGTGFGRVDSQPADGMPAPADPLARTITPITCWAWGADNLTKMDIPVLFTGLAPGLAGVYQMDVRVPEANLRSSVQLNCIGEGDNSNFLGSFAVKP